MRWNMRWNPYCGVAPTPAEFIGRWNLDPWLLAALLRRLWETDRPVAPREADIGAGIMVATYATGPHTHGWWAMAILLVVTGMIFLMAVFSYLYLYGIHPGFWIPAGARLAGGDPWRMRRGDRAGTGRAPSSHPARDDAMDAADADPVGGRRADRELRRRSLAARNSRGCAVSPALCRRQRVRSGTLARGLAIAVTLAALIADGAVFLCAARWQCGTDDRFSHWLASLGLLIAGTPSIAIVWQGAPALLA